MTKAAQILERLRQQETVSVNSILDLIETVMQDEWQKGFSAARSDMERYDDRTQELCPHADSNQ